MIFSIILIIISPCISIIGIYYSLLKREIFGTYLNTVLNILLYVFFGIFFLPLYTLSAETSIEESIALWIWKLSLIFWMISISLLSIQQKLIIKIKKISNFPSILYAFIGGIIISLVILPSSIEILQGNDNGYYYRFNNSILLLSIVFFNIFILSLLIFYLFNNLSDLRDKIAGRNLSILTVQFGMVIVSFTLNLFTQITIFKFVYYAVYFIGALFVTYIMYKQPSLFLELTNKLFDFIIFHKSGILLYSFNFETRKETDDSLLKGSILIGINHILANFIDRKDQLSLIKMKDRDLIFEYDNKYDYAILLTTNHKHIFIEKAVRRFMRKFSDLNGEKLKNMKGLIDVSEFRNAKDLITEMFTPYIKKTNTE
ncbi:MAG: hypothetical protein ACFFA3_07325 [Promethearchaeota archaeon]